MIGLLVPTPYSQPVRPEGVRERVRQLVEDERAVVDSWTDRLLRRELRYFVTMCALLGYSDHSAAVVVRGFRGVDAALVDPDQIRTGSDVEARSLAVVEELRPILGPLAARGDDQLTLDELDGAVAPVLDIPPRVILGDDGPDRYFDLVCWNEANAVAEGMQRPYFAAARISNEGFHKPLDRFELVEPLSAMVFRYEDVPERRDDTARAIVETLAAFRAAAPWPLPAS